jgi:hypothetical protein
MEADTRKPNGAKPLRDASYFVMPIEAANSASADDIESRQ